VLQGQEAKDVQRVVSRARGRVQGAGLGHAAPLCHFSHYFKQRRALAGPVLGGKDARGRPNARITKLTPELTLG
jgi:hypothetical protein